MADERLKLTDLLRSNDLPHACRRTDPKCRAMQPSVAEGIRICGNCGQEILGPTHWFLAQILVRQDRTAKELARIRQLLEEQAAPENDDEGDGLLSPAQLAKRLGRSPQWVRDHSEQLGGIRNGEGPKPRYWFDLELARERLVALAGSNGSNPKPAPKQGRRRKRSSGDAELLPIKRDG